MDGQTESWIDGWLDGWMLDGWMMDEWMAGWIFSAFSKLCCVCSSVCDQDCEQISGGLRSFAVLTRRLTFHLQQLHRRTEQELSNIHTQ